eukprot:8136313-Ditylum_brightwellii.AAC.1
MYLFVKSVNKDSWEESFPLQDENDEGEYNHIKHDQYVYDRKVHHALNAIKTTSNHHEYTSKESSNSKVKEPSSVIVSILPNMLIFPPAP